MIVAMKVTLVAGCFALVAAFLLGGRYTVAVNTNGLAVVDRFSGAVYINGTSLHVSKP